MSELIWGWGAFVFGLVGMVAAVVTAIVAIKAYKLAKQEFLNSDIGTKLRKEKLLKQLQAFKSVKLENLNLTKVSHVILQLLDLDPYTPCPYKTDYKDEEIGCVEYQLSYCYMILHQMILKKQVNQKSSSK